MIWDLVATERGAINLQTNARISLSNPWFFPNYPLAKSALTSSPHDLEDAPPEVVLATLWLIRRSPEEPAGGAPLEE